MKLIGPDGTEYPLEKPLTTIGRRADNDIAFDDRRVSGSHAFVRRLGRRFLLEDAGSTNGTLVNGELIKEPHELKDGDQVAIGFTVLTFRAAPRTPSDSEKVATIADPVPVLGQADARTLIDDLPLPGTEPLHAEAAPAPDVVAPVSSPAHAPAPAPAPAPIQVPVVAAPVAPPGLAPPARPDRFALAVASLTLGLMSLLAAVTAQFIELVAVCWGVCAVAGLATGIFALNTSQGRRLAMAGLAVSALGLAGLLCYGVVWIASSLF